MTGRKITAKRIGRVRLAHDLQPKIGGPEQLDGHTAGGLRRFRLSHHADLVSALNLCRKEPGPRGERRCRGLRENAGELQVPKPQPRTGRSA